jgi:hypothetical protein
MTCRSTQMADGGLQVGIVNPDVVPAQLAGDRGNGYPVHYATNPAIVRYANATRRVAPAEQHVHGILEMTPAIATAIIAILNWPDFLSLFGVGDARFVLQLKHNAPFRLVSRGRHGRRSPVRRAALMGRN